MPDIPEEGSWWEHRNGNRYMVIAVVNESDTERYPLTVVYRGENGKWWARRADDWHRSMTTIQRPLPPMRLFRL